MFFILSVDPKKLTVKIVGHASSIEDAIHIVSEKADMYVKSKNNPIMHRGTEDVTFTDRVIYFTRKSPDHDYQLDVFQQQTKPHKGWTGTSYKDEEVLVRRFIYTNYNEYNPNIPDAPIPPPVETNAKITLSDRTAKVIAMGLDKCGGQIPQSVTLSLQENERFKQCRIDADSNRLPPPFRTMLLRATDLEDSSESSDK